MSEYGHLLGHPLFCGCRSLIIERTNKREHNNLIAYRLTCSNCTMPQSCLYPSGCFCNLCKEYTKNYHDLRREKRFPMSQSERHMRNQVLISSVNWAQIRSGWVFTRSGEDPTAIGSLPDMGASTRRERFYQNFTTTAATFATLAS